MENWSLGRGVIPLEALEVTGCSAHASSKLSDAMIGAQGTLHPTWPSEAQGTAEAKSSLRQSRCR
jgi:hypothetical protein